MQCNAKILTSQCTDMALATTLLCRSGSRATASLTALRQVCCHPQIAKIDDKLRLGEQRLSMKGIMVRVACCLVYAHCKSAQRVHFNVLSERSVLCATYSSLSHCLHSEGFSTISIPNFSEANPKPPSTAAQAKLVLRAYSEFDSEACKWAAAKIVMAALTVRRLIHNNNLH